MLVALGAMPMVHPLSLGMLGMHVARRTNFVLQKADLLTVPGVRFDDRTISKTEQFCLNAAIFHVEIDHTELGNVGQANVALHAEVGQLLQQLLLLIQAKPHTEWLGIVNGLRREFPFNMPNAPHPLSR